jgi:hypothetical protein
LERWSVFGALEHWWNVGALESFWSVGALLKSRLLSFSLLVCSILFSLVGLSFGIQLLSLGLPSKNILPAFGSVVKCGKGGLVSSAALGIFMVANHITGKALPTFSNQ